MIIETSGSGNEQWMGAEPGPHFDANSNIHWAPKMTGKLLLVHGELDENVPPANSLRLADALIKANKDFEFLIVPNADHILEVVPYFHRRRWDFFVKELLGKTPPEGYEEALRLTLVAPPFLRAAPAVAKLRPCQARHSTGHIS